MPGSSKSSSLSSVSREQKPFSPAVGTSKSKSPVTSDFEYVGRTVTHERPILKKSRSSHYTHQRSRQQISEEDSGASGEEYNNLSGTIKINDRHTREIYRLPTPPPQVKQVYHRAPSPEPKIIERIYVRRPAPEIIENVIGIPPEKVKIINREKVLRPAKPIIRTRIVHLKSDQEQQQQQQSPSTLNQQSATPSYFGSNQMTYPIASQATCYSYQPPMNFAQQYNQYQ